MKPVENERLLHDLTAFRDHTGMYVRAEDSFDCIAAFLTGYDLATKCRLLGGFQEWGRQWKWREQKPFFVLNEVEYAVNKRQDLAGCDPIAFLMDALIEFHTQGGDANEPS